MPERMRPIGRTHRYAMLESAVLDDKYARGLRALDPARVFGAYLAAGETQDQAARLLALWAAREFGQ